MSPARTTRRYSRRSSSSTTAARRACRPRCSIPPGIDDVEALAEFLGERRGARVVVRTPLRGEKRRLVELAAENAQLALEADAAVREAARSKRIAALEELREVLNLESLPVRIECFDVSNTQGDSIVASMTVFVDGKPKNAHYRTFAIRGLDGQDDVGAMREAVSRRFARMRATEQDESFCADAEPRGRRRREGAARRGARRHRGARPAAGRGDLAREARGGGLRSGIPGRNRPRPARAPRCRCLSGFATRRTVSPFASIGAGARSTRWRRSSRACQAWGRYGARAIIRALRLRRAVPRGLPGGARGRSGAASEDGTRPVRAAPQSRAVLAFRRVHETVPIRSMPNADIR